MKAKSDENIKAAELLIKEKKFASSVHCSYYAYFQMLKYTLHTKLSCDYNKQNSKGSGSHNNVVKLFDAEIKNQGINLQFDIKTNIRTIKTRRNAADYSRKKISYSQATKMHHISNDIISVLNKI